MRRSLLCLALSLSLPARTETAGTNTGTLQPVVEVFAPDSLAAETVSGQNPNNGHFLISRHGNTNVAVTVFWSISGTATGNHDFQPIPTSITLAAGQIRAEIPLRPLDDTEAEPEETVVLRLLAPPCAQIFPPPPDCLLLGKAVEAVVRIADNDVTTPKLTLSAGSTHATEAGAPANVSTNRLTFLVRRHLNTAGSLSAGLQWGGSAARGLDYFAPETVTFAPGQSELVVIAQPAQDNLVEGDESVTVALRPCVSNSASICYILGTPSQAGGVIQDDDRVPENRAPQVGWMTPGNGAVFTAPPEIRLAASAGDADGEVRRVTFLVNGAPVGTVTNATSALASFSGASTASAYEWIWANPAPGEYHLQAEAADDDGAVARSAVATIWVRAASTLQTVVSLHAPDREALEPLPGETAVNRGVFRARREGDLSVTLRVPVRVDGTASNGVDCAELPTHLHFAAGQGVIELVVTPRADDRAEGPEVVRLTLLPSDCPPQNAPPPECYRLGSVFSDHVVIGDRQPPPNHAPIAHILNPWQGQVFRAPATIRLLAEAWDCEGPVERVEFFSGDRSLGLAERVEFTTNTVAELQGMLAPRPDHARFHLLWTNVPTGRHVLRAVATDAAGVRGASRPVEIKVVEMPAPPVVTLDVADGVAAETALSSGEPDTAEFVVRRTGPTNLPLRVFLRLGGSALPGLDYVRPEFPGVIIPAGAHTARFRVVPLDDALPEGPEAVEIAVVPPRWLVCADGGSLLPVQYLVGEPARAHARILDNDVPSTNHFPRVRLVRPETGALFTAPARIGLAAEAVDHDGAVVAVEFLANGGVVGALPGLSDNSTNATYTLAWENVPAGEYTVVAQATDNRGAVAQSEPVTVTVAEPDAPVEVEVFTVDPHASEGANGNSGPDVARFRFRRDGDATGDLSVRYTVGGTASNGVDYARLNGVAVIPDGDLSVLVEVVPFTDNQVEPDAETVVVTLSTNNVPGYVAGRRFEAAAYIVDEGDTPAPGQAGAAGEGELVLDLPVAADGAVSVQVSTNLVDWVHITTLPATNGRVRFVDPGARRLGQRFYQAVPAPIQVDTLDD